MEKNNLEDENFSYPLPKKSVNYNWKGYWIQGDAVSSTKGEMNCKISIDPSGCLKGTGKDIVGSFTWVGQISKGDQIIMVKQYIGKHKVEYVGKFINENEMEGSWDINKLDFGKFYLKKQ